MNDVKNINERRYKLPFKQLYIPGRGEERKCSKAVLTWYFSENVVVPSEGSDVMYMLCATGTVNVLSLDGASVL